MNDLLGGQVDFMCDQTTNTISQIKAGKIKVYGVTTKTRVPSLPDVPTMQEAGLPGFEVSVWQGLYAPKGTPKPIMDKLTKALQTALADPTLKQALCGTGHGAGVEGRAPLPRRCGCTSSPRSTSGRRSSRRPASTPTDPMTTGQQ